MSEPTPIHRVLMLLKTVASIASWVGALAFGFVRGKVKAKSSGS